MPADRHNTMLSHPLHLPVVMRVPSEDFHPVAFHQVNHHHSVEGAAAVEPAVGLAVVLAEADANAMRATIAQLAHQDQKVSPENLERMVNLASLERLDSQERTCKPYDNNTEDVSLVHVDQWDPQEHQDEQAAGVWPALPEEMACLGVMDNQVHQGQWESWAKKEGTDQMDRLVPRDLMRSLSLVETDLRVSAEAKVTRESRVSRDSMAASESQAPRVRRERWVPQVHEAARVQEDRQERQARAERTHSTANVPLVEDRNSVIKSQNCSTTVTTHLFK